MKKFKILLLNLGYCTKLNGSILDYLTKSYRYLFTSKKVQESALNKLNEIIVKEEPDLICLMEIERGMQIRELINNDYKYFDIARKYGKHSILRYLPFFKDNCNAFISKKKMPFKKGYLKRGTKKLVYEIELPNKTTLVFAHFSLKKRIRKKQFREISKKYAKDKSKIICGDFNILRGLKELNYLIEKSKLNVVNKKSTFPAFKPKKDLDLFLCSKDLKCKTKVLHNQLSDHLPVILEFRH